jgi:hypothetical protein
VPLISGPYRPTYLHTDDYPSIKIAAETTRGQVAFFTQSQGARHTPWGVLVGDTPFVVAGDEPQQALDLLGPYLKRDVFKDVQEEAERTFLK